MTFTPYSQAFISKPLTNFSLGYFNDPKEFIATRIFPIFNVWENVKTGKVWSSGKGALRIVDTARATYGAYNEKNLTVELNNAFTLEDYGLTWDIFEEDVRFQDKPILDIKMDTVQDLTSSLMLDMEKKMADVLTNPSIMTQNLQLSGADQRDEYTTSDPFSDIRVAVSTIKEKSGKIANTLILWWNVMQTLMDHPMLINRFPGSAVITQDMVAAKLGAMFGIQNVLVWSAQHNDTNLWASSEPLSFIWSNVCIVAYIEQTPNRKTRTLGRTFSSKGSWNVYDVPASQLGKDAMKRKQVSMAMVNMEYDQVLIDAECGYLIYDVL